MRIFVKPPIFSLSNRLLKPSCFYFLLMSSAAVVTASSSANNKTFETLHFDNLALRSLPVDPITENYTREVRNACFSRVQPTPLKSPSLVSFSKDAMQLLDLDEQQLKRKESAEYLSGNKLIPGSETAAHCYCGHQFGSFAGQLGDGAAMYLGEVINSKKERWEIQFKGAGLTPYSRTADGRKVLRSTLREFLCSEAMHFLGVDTTRAGSCVSSETSVVRDMFYDGNPRLEKCAVVLRIAPTFIRFGSFEIFLGMSPATGGRGPSFGRVDLQKCLLDYVCDTFFSNLVESNSAEVKYEKVFEEIVRRTARLVAMWQCYGFVHGVLNTDNMSILGLTIDYGPFGFLDRYNPDHIFNESDQGGRYTYRNQVKICEWNCVKLAEALKPVLDLERSKKIVSDRFQKEFQASYLAKMRLKLGLKEIAERNEEDEKLIEELFEVMYETGADFTGSFRKLSQLRFSGEDRIEQDVAELVKALSVECCSSVDEYKSFFKPKLPKDTLAKIVKAAEEEPSILNYFGLSERFVKNEVVFTEKQEKIRDFTEEDKRRVNCEQWSGWLVKYMRRVYAEGDLGNNSSNNDDNNYYWEQRVKSMNKNNPRFVLRNHVAQEAIEAADKDQFEEANMLLRVLENAFSEESVENILIGFDNKELLPEVISFF